MNQYTQSACKIHRDLILKMGRDGEPLDVIARLVKTNSRHIRAFLNREGVVRKYPKNYGGARHPNWKGGRIVTKKGYVYLWMPEHPNHNHLGYVLEHRVVMEKMIGRLLLPQEVVHHKDKNRGNNHPDNLQLFSENREHLAMELKGHRPHWTPDGLARLKKSAARTGDRRRGTNDWHWRMKLKLGAQPSQKT